MLWSQHEWSVIDVASVLTSQQISGVHKSSAVPPECVILLEAGNTLIDTQRGTLDTIEKKWYVNNYTVRSYRDVMVVTHLTLW